MNSCLLLSIKGRPQKEEQLTLFAPALDEISKKDPRISLIGSQITGQREWIYGDPNPAEDALPMPEPQPVTQKQQENSFRREIEFHLRRYSQKNRIKQQSINSEIKNYFGKSRQEMTNGELGVVLEFVKRNYPTGYQGRGRRKPMSRTVEVFKG